MTSPARDFRLQAQQKWPGATIIDRKRNSIYHKHPTLPLVMIDASIEAIHTVNNQEIDTAWKTSISPWDYEITLADYITRVKLQFNAADVLQWEKGGQTISFITRQLEWTNDRNDIQLVANPQAVLASINDNRINWTNAFGSGLDFTWINRTDRLVKLLTIGNLSNLVTPSSQILTGGNPALRVQFQFSLSSNIDIYISGTRWNQTGQRDTTGSVEFRHSTTGESLWFFDPGKAWDTPPIGNDQNQIVPITRFRKTGPSLFVEIRVPWEYLQSASFPIYIDPTIDVSVGASADDAEENASGTTNITNTVISNQIDNTGEWGAFRFTGITITSYSSMVASYLTFYFATASADEPDVTIYGEDTSSPSAYSAGVGNYNISGRTRTTTSIDWGNTNLGAPGSFNTGSINTIIDELATSYSYSSGVMAFDLKSRANDTSRDCTISTWDNTTDAAPALHIEYNQSGTAYTKTLTATIEIADTISRIIGRYKTLTETTEIADAITNSRNINRTKTSTVNVSDTLSKILNKVKTLTNTINISDTISSAKLLFKTLTDSINISDALTNSIGRFKTLSNTVQISDTLINVREIFKSLLNTVQTSDTIITARGIFRSISNNIQISDIISNIRNLNKIFTSTIQVSDITTNSRGISKLLSNTIQVSDIIENLKLLVRNLTSSVQISDTITNIRNIRKTISNAINTSDTITNIRNILRTLTDTENITSVISTARNIIKNLTDSISITDIINALKLGAEKFVTLTDSIQVSDVISNARLLLKNISNSIQTSDTITNLRSLSRTIIETINITDLLSTSRNIIKNISESISISSVVINSRNLFRTITSSINISDLLIAIKIKLVLLTNTINISDTISTVVEEFINIAREKFKVYLIGSRDLISRLIGSFKRKNTLLGSKDKDEHFTG